MTSPGPDHRGVAELLLRKGAEDLHAARVFAADPDRADHIVGFHAQQAVEKAIKAVLSSRAIEIPRSHDLAYLVGLLPADAALPGGADAIRWLTPWGVAWRYDDPADHLDVIRAVEVADVVVGWANDRTVH